MGCSEDVCTSGPEGESQEFKGLNADLSTDRNTFCPALNNNIETKDFSLNNRKPKEISMTVLGFKRMSF